MDSFEILGPKNPKTMKLVLTEIWRVSGWESPGTNLAPYNNTSNIYFERD